MENIHITNNINNTNNTDNSYNNINTIDNSYNNTNNIKIPKKKGRKPKNHNLNNLTTSDISINIVDVSCNNLPKKRGRKPKGGKILITKNIIVNNDTQQNIILHLNCKINDIDYLYKYTPDIQNINSYNFNANDNFENIEEYQNPLNTQNNLKNDIYEFKEIKVDNKDKNKDNYNIKNISNKINLLDTNKNKSDIACFWCTYSFNSSPVYIPKNIKKNIYNMYGNFCSLECACGFLFNENIDSSIKFERYTILNNLYNNNFQNPNSDIINIKPAPCPYYTLDKFYGNLTIDEYRDLYKLDKYMLILDKPISKVIPEVFQENINNNFIFKK
tara:strand:+ start:4319 stop:5308 length:990 start_codon:yes stop_codon:yes gene_type:complete